MNAIETRKYEMLVRVRDFGESHGDLFPKSSLAGQTFAEVATAVKELSQHAVAKMSAAGDSARARAAARNALRTRLNRIHTTARAVARETPDVEGKFQLPEVHTDQALLTTGRLFARDVEPLLAKFVTRAMPKTLVADVNGLIEKLERAIHACEAEREERTAARVNIEAALSSGLGAAQALDVMVANHLQDDPVGIAVWESARRTDYPRRSRKAVAAAAAPLAAVPAAPAPPAPPAEPAPAASTPHTTSVALVDKAVA